MAGVSLELVKPLDPIDLKFGDDTIPAIAGETRDDWSIVLKPTCENMGVDFNGQYQKLKREHWARMCVTHIRDSAGRIQETITIDRPTFKMWMLKFTSSRIKDPVVRAKIERYQLEAVEFIDRYFDSDLNPIEAQSAGSAQLAAIVSRLDSILARQQETIQSLQIELARVVSSHDGLAIRPQREAPPQWHRVIKWARGLGIVVPNKEHSKQGQICAEISQRNGIVPIWAQPPGERHPANYYPEFVLHRWLKRYLTENPIWKEMNLFQID